MKLQYRKEAPLPWLLLVAVWLVLGALWCSTLDHRPLGRPDEGRYGEIAREMAKGGDFVTPRLNGIQYFEKPPLQYWATAIAYQSFGVNEQTARLWATACGFLSIVLTAWMARLAGLNAAGGLLAAVVMAGALYPALLGHVNTLDAGVTAFLTATVACYLQAQRSAASPRWMALAGASAGLAMLSKGLIALVLPGVGLALYTVCTLSLSGWRRLHLPQVLLTLLLVAGPWFVLVSWRNPAFPHFFFIHEHFERFASTVHRRVEPGWYFLPLLLCGLLPWTLLLPAALVRAWSTGPVNPEGFRPQRFLLCYALGVVAFFSASGSKLPSYIYPAFPPLAVLLTHALQQGPALPRRLLTLGGLALSGVLGLAGLLLLGRGLDRALGISLDMDADMITPYAQLAPWLLIGSFAVALGVIALRLLPAQRRLLACLLLGLSTLLAAQASLHGASALAEFNSSRPWVEANALRTRIPADARLFSVGTYDQTLDFYLDRTVILVDFLDELEFGLQQEPALSIPSEAAFRATWGSQPGDHAVMEPARYAHLLSTGLPMRLVARDSRHVLVSAP